ncbi:MAG: hypothetical protein NTW75_13100 [Planctomycetales bacterium]|nr:hypothetical protein [Planctomycetales bacterium]
MMLSFASYEMSTASGNGVSSEATVLLRRPRYSAHRPWSYLPELECRPSMRSTNANERGYSTTAVTANHQRGGTMIYRHGS